MNEAECIILATLFGRCAGLLAQAAQVCDATARGLAELGDSRADPRPDDDDDDDDDESDAESED